MNYNNDAGKITNMKLVDLPQVNCVHEDRFDLYLFTDGSARKISRKLTCAGWRFIGMNSYRNVVCAPVVSACGPVQTNEQGELWVGAMRATNNTAEMQAMIEAL